MRQEKINLSNYISGVIEESNFLFFIGYKGLTVSQFDELRSQLYAQDARCHVLKNTLIKIGLERHNIGLPENYALNGDTSVVFGNGDPSSVAKIIRNFGKEHQAVKFKAGVIADTFVGASDAECIADLPSKEVMQAQFLSVLQAPMVSFVRVLNATPTNLLNLLQAYKEKIEKVS